MISSIFLLLFKLEIFFLHSHSFKKYIKFSDLTAIYNLDNNGFKSVHIFSYMMWIHYHGQSHGDHEYELCDDNQNYLTIHMLANLQL